MYICVHIYAITAATVEALVSGKATVTASAVGSHISGNVIICIDTEYL